MTYLELVNAVLTRLREDQVLTVDGSDDVVVNIVKNLVNDAKKTCESAHTWSALAKEWTVSTSTDSDAVVIPDSSETVVLEDVFTADGVEVSTVDKTYLRKRALQSSGNGTPRYYIVDGKEVNGDTRLRVWPTPSSAETLHVYGYQTTPDLVQDSDRLYIPSKPVIYLAQALASRERGEDGSLQASELLALAKQYMSDAIAVDATNNEPENVWNTI
jgi:hypothetical protein